MRHGISIVVTADWQGAPEKETGGMEMIPSSSPVPRERLIGTI